ncbi:hypothetical protein [Roseateles koreensis]|uniref:Thymidine kinase n=1 Tax=Roseateles koreensis TaxID=2987526 RepID=A0ABT5KQ34_9BURK|nr:hypothetical protein [Roseateles koreensis]MDC8784570.1 hypothetical protein [Roseateles koreensis]
MNAGKSMALRHAAYSHEERGHPLCLYTAQLDDRYGSRFRQA